MEQGTVHDAMDWGVGRIDPDSHNGLVIFTRNVATGGWAQYFAGRRVQFERYATGGEAKRVMPL